MITTLTPNPSVDRAIVIDALVRGEVLRASSTRIDPGGKGVNVSRALSAQSYETLAVVPVGGPEGHLLAELLDDAGVPHRDVAIAGSIRMNISVLEPDGTTTKLNEPGPFLDERACDAVVAATLESALPGGWIAACGSLPPGAPANLYAQLIVSARARGSRVAVDSSGTPLAEAVRALPDLIKPNHEELEELVGRELPTLGDVLDAATHLVESGIAIVAVSLGRHGAVLVSATEVAHARASITDPQSTVGAGDCMLAGLLHGLNSGLSATDALALGVTWGAAAVTLPGSSVPTRENLRGIDATVELNPRRDLLLGR
jgi:1-phosphofructokinase